MQYCYLVKVDGREIEVSGDMEVDQYCTCFSDKDVHPHMIDCDIDAACYFDTGLDVMVDDAMRHKLVAAIENEYYKEVGSPDYYDAEDYGYALAD